MKIYTPGGFGKGTPSEVAEQLDFALALGGAAVYRCDNLHAFNSGCSR